MWLVFDTSLIMRFYTTFGAAMSWKTLRYGKSSTKVVTVILNFFFHLGCKLVLTVTYVV